jgi:hypothetical protein
MVRLALAVAVILTLASSGASAQSPEAQPPGAQQPGAQPPGAQQPRAPAWYAACKLDVAQFCKEVQPGGGRILSCFKQHSPELSQGCKQALTQARLQQ